MPKNGVLQDQIFWKVCQMPAYVLAPCVVRSSTDIVLTLEFSVSLPVIIYVNI